MPPILYFVRLEKILHDRPYQTSGLLILDDNTDEIKRPYVRNSPITRDFGEKNGVSANLPT